ncbi:MAG TPA: serine/threonine-protein kinase [Rudaea sp.]|nr:serine/threonine-protein kinase [Rudaea sp.]
MDLKPGQSLGSYYITERLVAGGMAKVYRARQPSTERDVALKVLTLESDPSLQTRFEREAKLLAHLQHPHILGLIDAGCDGPWHYLVVPLVRCGDLADLIAREDGPLPLPMVRRVMLQLLSALEYAHAQGVVHRDVKPANILLDERGNCVLTDFGIALTASAERLTMVGYAVGTPEYFAPEQAQGQYDARSDLYSAGMILFEMATGRLPFREHSPTEWLRAHRETPVPSAHALNPALPAALDAVIAKALAKDPKDRYQNAAQFAAAIRDAVPESVDSENPAQRAPPPTTVIRAAAPTSKPRVPVLALAGVVAVAVLAALAFWQPWRAPASTSVAPAAAASPATPTPVSPAPPATPSAGLADAFDDPRFEYRYDASRWRPTRADARMRMEQRSGALHIETQEREHGLYAELRDTHVECVSARVRLDAPVAASEGTVGIIVSRADRPGEWVSCYLYATRGAALAAPACTDQRRSEFRAGTAEAVGGWHEVTMRVDAAQDRIAFRSDGRPLGDLPFAGAGAATTWYVTLAGWSADGNVVSGDVTAVTTACR